MLLLSMSDYEALMCSIGFSVCADGLEGKKPNRERF